MVAFEFEPSVWPEESAFERPMREGQRDQLCRIRDNQPGISPKMFRQMCGAILEEYGLPDSINEGSADVLIGFFRGSSARHKRAAERKAFAYIYGQKLPD